MKLIYLGPRDAILVGSFGEHRRGEVKEYPDGFANDLMDTSVRQRFVVGANNHSPLHESPVQGPDDGEMPECRNAVIPEYPLTVVAGGKRKKAGKS